MPGYSQIEDTGTNLEYDPDLETELFARNAEVENYKDLEKQRGTPIPALFNFFYKFIQNPSTVSVETFKRMVDTDDVVGSGVDFLTAALAARIGQYQHKNQEITEFVIKALENMEGGFNKGVKELLSASWAGFSVSELVWANTPEGFIIKKMVSLPPSTVLFEVDRGGAITEDGILQYQRNYNPAFTGGSNYLFGFATPSFLPGQRFRPDTFAKLGDYPFPLRVANTFAYLSIRIPKMKCVHYSFAAQGNFDNPYGRSLLRRAYKYYVMKDAFLQMLAVALDRKGTPLTIVYVDPNLTVIDDQKFTPGMSNRGKDVGIRADLAAQRAFKNIHNDTTIFLPGKKGQNFDVDFMPQSPNAEGFISSINECNKAFLRALLIPPLVFTGGDGAGSYSLGQEHAKTFEKLCDSILSEFNQVLLQQIIKPLIAYNFPEATWKKDGLGSFSKRQLTGEEINKEMEIVEKGVNIGAIDMNDMRDLNAIREKMGLEPRTAPIEKIEENPFNEEEDEEEPKDEKSDKI